MKRAGLAVTSLLVLVVLSLCGLASGQGCGQISIDEGNIKCCNGTETQENRSCGGSGNASDFCSEGYGECCGTQYSTTNVTYDPLECGGGCCDGTIECPRYHSCDMGTCGCIISGSPIIVDTIGKGFHLTSIEKGVTFDIFANRRPVKMAWTEADSGNAFLALDRDGDGRIDSGKELFGNVTAQPKSDDANGYLALAEFDKPENGGNGDGIIDGRDAVFTHLLLWVDENHDGISQPNELHALPELGVFSIGLRYRDEPLTDKYGNQFRYRGVLNPDPLDGESKDGRYTYDVFFVVGGGRQQAGLARPRTSRITEGECPRRLNLRLLIDDRLEIGEPKFDRPFNPSPDKQTDSGGSK